MIEIPKYSVPTYNKEGQCYNERSDFTRRIPALKPKQLARDSKIAAQIVRAGEGGTDGNAEAKVLDIFLRKAHLLSNPRYWELMRTVWVAAGSTETAETFRKMMRSSRPCKSWFMTPEDAEALDNMDFPLTVYRAYDKKQYPGDTDPGISWTIDKEWCEGYAASKGRVIKERQVYRKDIFAYVSRRGEEEIIIL